MTKEQKQLITIITLFSIAGLLWVRMMFKPKSSQEIPLSESPSQPASGLDFFKLEDELKDKRSQLEWTRDPFQFPIIQVIKKTAVEGLNLTGIIYDKELPVAVINDIIVHEGDSIEGAVVKEIKTNSVALEKDGKLYTLELIKMER